MADDRSTADDEQFWSGLEDYAVELHRAEQPIRQRHASIRAYAYAEGFSLKDNEIGFVDKQAERKLHDWKDGYDASEVIRVPRTQWFWEGIFLLYRLNLLIAREKVGKTALMCFLIRTWLSGCAMAMGLGLAKPPKHPAILIAGPDQGLADWSWYLAKAGLATETVIDDDSADIRLVPEIKKIWPQDAPVFLDEEGIANIAKHCEKHPGALLILDSLATLNGPLGLKENDADFAEPMRALARALAPHRTTAILIHHAGKGNEAERASTASRGSTAITAAASRVVQLAWLNEKDKTDNRIALTTQGRAAKPVGLVIEQEEACQFIKVGDLEEIAKEEAREKSRNSLTERQELALAEVCDAWEEGRHEMTATWLVERLPAKYTGNGATRKARANLDQLYGKELVDKRTLGSGDARRNMYRPWEADLGEVRLRPLVSPEDPPESPDSPNPSNHGLSEEQLPLMSLDQISAEGKEGAEGASKTQPVIRGEDDPHWGPRPTTNRNEVG